ncbi:MAG: hypothetical protein QOK19_1945 [Solirubrobacteraceae bacterium]|nr:hypothetical protein [Solirubrobacterales bacterium]MEA2216384.1 hypothetical protein [Solirubrobacteraceae bacterium]
MRAGLRARASCAGLRVRIGASGLAVAALLAASPAAAPSSTAAGGSYAVGMRVLRFVDGSRLARPLHRRPETRKLPMVLRYPAAGATNVPESVGTPAAKGPFPLIVFAHGFAVTPATYSRLLASWTRAGYVVAAPVFPLENANAPGGPLESDLVNEPADISFVISKLLAASATPGTALSGLIDPSRIAVAGQSDGAMAALATAYSRRLRDPRVRAAVILSGAEMSGIGGYSFAEGEPPLLAAQGTADTSNEPRYTYAYFRAARHPKYLLRLLGAEHLPPYTTQQPQLGVVERVSAAFLDGYLRGGTGVAQRLATLGSSAGTATLSAQP